MDSIDLLKSGRLFLVNCQIDDGLVKAGWVFTYGLLKPTEVLRGNDLEVVIQIPDFMQTATTPAEMYHDNDTVDFLRHDSNS